MRHGKHVPQGDGKREEKRGHFFQNSHFPIFPSSHITKNKCNKKDNILIYNNLGKNTIPCWDNGTMGQVGQVVQFCKEFYSLFPLSLAISLRFTLTISLVIIAILFSRTGKELCRIQLVRDV